VCGVLEPAQGHVAVRIIRYPIVMDSTAVALFCVGGLDLVFVSTTWTVKEQVPITLDLPRSRHSNSALASERGESIRRFALARFSGC